MSNKMFQTWNDLILGDLEDYGTLEKKSWQTSWRGIRGKKNSEISEK